VIDCLTKKATDDSDGVLVQGAGQTLLGTSRSDSSTDSNNVYLGASTELATTTSTTMSWTWTRGNRYTAHIAFGINGAGGGPPKVKTINGKAIASVKTINGKAIASVKSVQGLT
jgi:hypothetical protein